eukprot:gene16237-22403_t
MSFYSLGPSPGRPSLALVGCEVGLTTGRVATTQLLPVQPTFQIGVDQRSVEPGSLNSAGGCQITSQDCS